MAVYNLEIVTDNNQIYKIGENKYNSLNFFEKEVVVSETEKKTNKKVAEDKSCFNMTFGYFNIRDEKVGSFTDYVDFPFLESIEIEAFRIGSVAGVIPEHYRTNSKRIIDDDENPTVEKGYDLGTIKKGLNYNCTIRLNFKVPAQLRRYPDIEKVIEKLLLSLHLSSAKGLNIKYLSTPHESGSEDQLTIEDMKSIDYSSEFNPINSSSGFEELSFSRLFAGYLSDGSDTLRKQEEINEGLLKIEKEYEALDKESKKAENNISNSATDEDKKINAQKLADIERKKKEKKDALKAQLTSRGKNQHGNQIREFEKKSAHYSISNPFKITFISRDEIDFTNMWYADDTSAENIGIYQLHVVHEYLNERQYMEPGTYDVFTLKPVDKKDYNVNKENKVSKDPNKRLSRNKSMIGKNNVTNSINKESDIPGTRFEKAPAAFTLRVSLPRAILQLQILDTVELVNSVFGAYDGLWKVMKNTITYSETGQVTQEIDLITAKNFTTKFETKTNVKISKYKEKTDEELGVTDLLKEADKQDEFNKSEELKKQEELNKLKEQEELKKQEVLKEQEALKKQETLNKQEEFFNKYS